MGGSYQIKSGVHFANGIGGQAVLFRLILFKGTVLRNLALAFEATGNETGEDIEEAEVVAAIFSEGVLETFAAEVDKEFADLGNGDFGGSLVNGRAGSLGGEVEGQFVTEAAFVKALLVFEPVTVTTEFLPIGDVGRGKERGVVSDG